MDTEKEDHVKRNPDPITGAPGSHPIGTGVGTAAGGVAGAVIGAAAAGPVGAVVGAVVGGIAGATGGHGVAEAVNPSTEEAYWREKHAAQSYAKENVPFEAYAPAYRTGIEGITKYAGKEYHEIEDDLALDYQTNNPSAALPWDEARHATHAAWSKISGVVTPRDPSRGMRTGL